MSPKIENNKLHCPACGSIASFKPYTLSSSRGKDRQWARCLNCYSYFDPSEENVHKNTDYIVKDKGINLTMTKQHLYKQIIYLANKYKKAAQKKWVDVGCSFGGLIENAKENGFAVTGTDVLPEAVAYVKSKNIDAIQAYSVAELDREMRSDIFTVIDVNYYWPDQKVELMAIHERLAKDGILIMRVPNKAWLVRSGIYASKFSKCLGRRMMGRGLNDHRFSMPLPSLLKLVKQTGFSVETICIKNAYFSDDSKWSIKLSFYIGSIMYAVFGVHFAPGVIIVLKKV